MTLIAMTIIMKMAVLSATRSIGITIAMGIVMTAILIKMTIIMTMTAATVTIILGIGIGMT